MLSAIQLEKRITDMQLANVCNDDSIKRIQTARIDSLIWALNGGDIKSISQIEHRITRFKEELLAFSSEHNLDYKEKTARIDELQNLITYLQ